MEKIRGGGRVGGKKHQNSPTSQLIMVKNYVFISVSLSGRRRKVLKPKKKQQERRDLQNVHAPK